MRKTTIPGHKQSICGSVHDQGLYDLFLWTPVHSKQVEQFHDCCLAGIGS